LPRPRTHPTSRLGKLRHDIAGIFRICGLQTAACWIAALVVSLPTILRRRDLQPADRLLGPGPLTVRYPGLATPFRIKGPRALSGIREMYVRDCYLGHGLLVIHDGDIVLNLGANMGNFANLALAHGPRVRVVAVEPKHENNSFFWELLRCNPGHEERATLLQAFVGNRTAVQTRISEHGDACAAARWLTPEELIEECGLHRINFLKCDIEGSEFGLRSSGSPLLAMTHSLAAEVHAWGGSP
jgi:FkbM family methyltransferase